MCANFCCLLVFCLVAQLLELILAASSAESITSWCAGRKFLHSADISPYHSSQRNSHFLPARRTSYGPVAKSQTIVAVMWLHSTTNSA